MVTIINKYNDHSEKRLFIIFTLFTHFQLLFTNSQNDHKQIYWSLDWTTSVGSASNNNKFYHSNNYLHWIRKIGQKYMLTKKTNIKIQFFLKTFNIVFFFYSKKNKCILKHKNRYLGYFTSSVQMRQLFTILSLFQMEWHGLGISICWPQIHF